MFIVSIPAYDPNIHNKEDFLQGGYDEYLKFFTKPQKTFGIPYGSRWSIKIFINETDSREWYVSKNIVTVLDQDEEKLYKKKAVMDRIHKRHIR